MHTPWIAQLFYRLNDWLPRRAKPLAVGASGRVHIRIGVPSLQPWQNIDSDLPDWNSSDWLNSRHARAAVAEAETAAISPGRGAITPLPQIRQEFIASLRDISSVTVRDLQQRIRVCPSLRGLWHLRADVFNEVALQHSEHEAQSRFARLNRHFPSPARHLIHEVNQRAAPRPWSAP